MENSSDRANLTPLLVFDKIVKLGLEILQQVRTGLYANSRDRRDADFVILAFSCLVGAMDILFFWWSQSPNAMIPRHHISEASEPIEHNTNHTV
jgi:hypothetical protein